ncbi:uncharacterized protein LOC143055247 [Mytilus galloprovincialis]|uniref:uncharacterized protein LOC143055247 n=1 Tax=Mytilus galloprovincialis TaxID=29158 RepID=UPI003F7C9C2D
MAEVLNTIDTENNGQTLCSNEVDMCSNVSGIILSDVHRHSDCHLQITTVQGQCEIETSPGTYEILYEALRCSLPAPYMLNSTSSDIQILSFYNNSGKTVIKSAINTCRNFKVNISIHQITVSADHEIWEGMPSSFTSAKAVVLLLNKLSKYNVCIGNPDEEFQDVTVVGAGISHQSSPGIVAYREGDFCASIGAFTYHSTIRSSSCCLLVQHNRCKTCSQYRKSLKLRKQRLNQQAENRQKQGTDLMHSTYKHKDMSSEMLTNKLQQQKKHIQTLDSEISKMKRTVERDILQKGVTLGEIQNNEVKDLMATCQEEVYKAYPDENSFQRLFWEQQMKFNGSGNGMRWHPMIIRWCLFIRQKSSKAYDAVREAGFINLPSTRTLFDYSHYIKSATGFQTDVVKMLKEEAAKIGLFDEQWKSYVGLLFDEVKVKEDLVYDKNTGELVGYVDLDSVGNQILEIEKVTNNTSSKLAKFMLVLMVRGVTTSLKFPFAAFATTSITADFLYPIIWKAVQILESFVKLKVLFLTCDGASLNRRFFNLHRLNNELVYYTVNPHDTSRNFYFVSDVPHLLKTTRNCFSNSQSHKNTRRLWKDGKDISWLHLVRLFEEHCELDLYNPCPKLTRGHIDMTAFSYMKVNLAAQILSDTVANALEELYDEQVSETVNFIRNMNKFFDCMNVRSLFEGRNKRNPNLDPYRNLQDVRLNWLKTDFMNYLSTWKDSVVNRQGNFTKSQQAGMQLSYQTLQGLQISVNSITECTEFLLNEGAPFVLTHNFNQDPLEQHFGHLRHKTGANNNPTVYEVRNIMTQIRTIGAQALAPKRGNTQRGNINRVIDNTKLPRRRAIMF